MGGGWGRSRLRTVPRPLLPCKPATARQRLSPLVSREGRRATVGEGGARAVRGFPRLGLKPGASASVHKGIWRAWWKPPCYLTRAQTGASHASSPT